MKQHFGGFEVIQNTESENLYIRLVKTNDPTQASVYEDASGNIIISPQDYKALHLANGNFLALISILEKHLKQ